MGTPLLSLVLAAFPQQPAPAGLAPELVFVGDEAPVPFAAWGLGDGGVPAANAEAQLVTDDGVATTPGGVEVMALPAGVSLVFPSGRELLFAPDGFLHLRNGPAAGPFPSGVELFLGDGASVRVQRTGSRREPIAEVLVTAGGPATRIWRRGRAVDEPARDPVFGGQRLLCCGQGDEVYRATAITPLVVLERVLCPPVRESSTPPLRVAVLTAPLVRSLGDLPDRVESRVTAAQQESLALVAAAVRSAAAVFDATRPPPRVEREQARYALAGGYELAIELPTDHAPALQLFRGRARLPFVEWTLGPASEARLVGAAAETAEGHLSRGRVVLREAVPALAARQELREVQAAWHALRRLAR